MQSLHRVFEFTRLNREYLESQAFNVYCKEEEASAMQQSQSRIAVFDGLSTLQAVVAEKDARYLVSEGGATLLASVGLRIQQQRDRVSSVLDWISISEENGLRGGQDRRGEALRGATSRLLVRRDDKLFVGLAAPSFKSAPKTLTVPHDAHVGAIGTAAVSNNGMKPKGATNIGGKNPKGQPLPTTATNSTRVVGAATKVKPTTGGKQQGDSAAPSSTLSSPKKKPSSENAGTKNSAAVHKNNSEGTVGTANPSSEAAAKAFSSHVYDAMERALRENPSVLIMQMSEKEREKVAARIVFAHIMMSSFDLGKIEVPFCLPDNRLSTNIADDVAVVDGSGETNGDAKKTAAVIVHTAEWFSHKALVKALSISLPLVSSAASSSHEKHDQNGQPSLLNSTAGTTSNNFVSGETAEYFRAFLRKTHVSSHNPKEAAQLLPPPTVQLRHIWALLSAALLGPDGGLFWATSGVVNPKIRREYTVLTNKWPSEVMAMARRDALANTPLLSSPSPPALGTSQIPILPNHLSAADGTMLRAFELAGEKEMSAMLKLFDSIVTAPSNGSRMEQKEEDHRQHQKEEREEGRGVTNLNSYSQQPIRLGYLHEKLKALDDLFNFFLFVTPEVILSQLPIDRCKEEILYRRHWLIVVEICVRFLIHPSTSQSWADFNNPWLSENMNATSRSTEVTKSPAYMQRDGLQLSSSYSSSSASPVPPLAPPVKIVLDAAEGTNDHAVLLELLQDAIEFCGDFGGGKERDTAFFDYNASLAAYVEALQSTTEESGGKSPIVIGGAGGVGTLSKINNTNSNTGKAEITAPSPAQIRSSSASAAIQKVAASQSQRNKMNRRSELSSPVSDKEGTEAEVGVRCPLAHWGFSPISQEQVTTQLNSNTSTFSATSFPSAARPQQSEHIQIQGRRRPNSSTYSAAHHHFLSCISMTSSLSVAVDNKKAQVQHKGGTDDDHLVDDRVGVSAIYGHTSTHHAATSDRTNLFDDDDGDAGEEVACPFASVVEAAAIALERLANYTMRAVDPSSTPGDPRGVSLSPSHTHWGNRLLFLRFVEYQVKAMAGSWRSFTMLQRLGVSIRYSAVRVEKERLLLPPSPSPLTRAHSQESSATSSARSSARSDSGNSTTTTTPHHAQPHTHSVPPTNSFAVEVPPALATGAHRMAFPPPPLITRRIDTMSTKALNAWAVALGLGDEPLGSLLTAAKQKVASSSAMAEKEIISAVLSEMNCGDKQQKQKVTKETLSRVFRQLTSAIPPPIIDNSTNSASVVLLKTSSDLSLPMFISTRLSRYFKRKHDLLGKWEGLLGSALEEARVAAAEEEKALAAAAEEGRGGFNSGNSNSNASANNASTAAPPRVPLHAIIQTVSKSVMLSASKYFAKALGVNEGMTQTTTTSSRKSEKGTAGAGTISQSLSSEVRLNNQNILAALPTTFFTSESSCCPRASDGALLSPAALAHLSGVSPYAFCSPSLAASYSALASSAFSHPLMFTPSPSRELCSLLELVSLDLVLFGQGGTEDEKESVGKGDQTGEDNGPCTSVFCSNASTLGLRDQLVAKLALFSKASPATNTATVDQPYYSLFGLVAEEEAVFDIISGLGPLARIVSDIGSLQREQEARIGDAARDAQQQQQQQTQPQPQGGGGAQTSAGARKMGGAGGSAANNTTTPIPPASSSATTASSGTVVASSGGILQSYGSGTASFPEFSPSAPITVFRPRGPLLITSPLPPQKRHLVSAQLRSEGSPYAVHSMSAYFVLTQLLPKHTLTLEGVGWGGGGLVAGALYDNIERIKRLEAEVLLLGIASVSFPPPSTHTAQRASKTTVSFSSLASPIRPVCAGGPAGEALGAANAVLASEALAAAEKAGVGLGLGKESQQGQGFGGGAGGNVRRGGGGAANATALAQSPTGGNPAQQRPLLGCVAPLLGPTPHVSSIPLWMSSATVPSMTKLQRSFSASPSLFLNSGAQPLAFKPTTMRRSNFGSNSPPSAHNAVLGQPAEGGVGEEKERFGGNDSTASVGGDRSPTVAGDSTTSAPASPKANANKLTTAQQQALRPNAENAGSATELEFYSVSAVVGRSQGPACDAMREEGARILLAHLSSQCERVSAAASTVARSDEECEAIAAEVSMLLVRLWRAHVLQRVLSTPEKA